MASGDIRVGQINPEINMMSGREQKGTAASSKGDRCQQLVKTSNWAASEPQARALVRSNITQVASQDFWHENRTCLLNNVLEIIEKSFHENVPF